LSAWRASGTGLQLLHSSCRGNTGWQVFSVLSFSVYRREQKGKKEARKDKDKKADSEEQDKSREEENDDDDERIEEEEQNDEEEVDN